MEPHGTGVWCHAQTRLESHPPFYWLKMPFSSQYKPMHMAQKPLLWIYIEAGAHAVRKKVRTPAKYGPAKVYGSSPISRQGAACMLQ
jgi:hypothetical protein